MGRKELGFPEILLEGLFHNNSFTIFLPVVKRASKTSTWTLTSPLTTDKERSALVITLLI